MSLRTPVLALAATTLALTSLGVVTAPSGSAAERATSCTERNHVPEYKSGTIAQDPVITQLGSRTLPPGGSRSVTTNVSTRTNITAAAKVGGSVKTKIGNKLIGEAEVELHMDLSTSGSSTKTSSTTVTEKIANGTKRNQKYVFFRGTMKVYGGVLRSYCDIEGQEHFGTVKWQKAGTWQTFTFVDEGAARCGAGSTGAVPREALRIGCQ